MAGLTFSIKTPQLAEALCEGMTLQEDGAVVCGAGEDVCSCMLAPLDSGVEDCPWGRLRFRLFLPENCVCYLYAAAGSEPEPYLQDPDVSFAEKKRYLGGMGGQCFINKADVLLYALEGRYLWIAVEMTGGGAAFSDMKAYAPGDSFMEVFPEIYREKNSFFHRYLSIFSSIYNDFEDVLEQREDMLDIGKAPKKLLPVYLKWMGIDVDGGLWDEAFLRALLQEAPELILCKGTGNCVRRICRLFVGEEPTIVERSLLQRYAGSAQRKLYDSLYGDSPYDVTLLFPFAVDEHKKEQLLHLLKQFTPVRCRLRILFLEERGVLDSHTYLDRNAVVFSRRAGRVDVSALAEGKIILE